jgi:hypothetical protein
MLTFADHIIKFNCELHYSGELPDGIHILNTFRDNHEALRISIEFYRRFYNDTNKRRLILGINPGRFGAGITGIPFTDTIRLNGQCGIHFDKIRTFEPSSSFIYDMIEVYGGVNKFYSKFLISAVCPLGFTNVNSKGKAVNYNYYDSRELESLVTPFIVSSLNKHVQFGIERDVCYCLGTGKNDKFLRKLNSEHGFFKKIVTLEHPRFIMQYRARFKNDYIRKYVETLTPS